MKDKSRLPPHMRGVQKMNGRKYIWLLNHDGTPQRYWLDNYGKPDAEPRVAPEETEGE